MKSVSGKYLAKILKKQGWRLRRVKGSHRIYSHPDRKGIVTIPIHGSKDLRTGTQRTIMKQAGITEEML